MPHNQHKEGMTPNIVDISEEEKWQGSIDQIIRDNLIWYKEEGADHGDLVIAEEAIKISLTEALTSQRKELEEKIMAKMPREVRCHTVSSENSELYIGYDNGFNHCLSQCKESILSVFKEK